MLKRIFWLSLVAAVGWLLWRLWQQRQEDFSATTPLLAPLEPFGRHIPAPAQRATLVEPPPVVAAAPPEQAHAQEPAPTAPDSPPAVPVEPPPVVAAAPPEQAHAQEPAPADEPEVAGAAADLGEVIGYCPRCRAKRPISGAHAETTESGRRAARGTCPICGGNMFTFLPNKT